MRFYGLTLAASVLALGACGGNKDAATTDSTTTTTTAMTPAATDSSAMAAPAGGAAAGGATVAAAPATGKTTEVKMIGDAKGYRFDPANVTVKAGDAVKFIMVSGGPHNVAFDPAAVPADGKAQLSANMPNQQGELSSPNLMNPNEAYTISFANVKPGAYNYHCTPHLAMGMKGVITVQ